MITPREIQIAYETGLFYYIFFLGPLNASLAAPPAAHSGRCTMRGEQPRNQKRPKSDSTAANGDCTCSKENRRDPKDRNGIREPAVRAMQRFPHTRPIAPPRSGSTRPGLEIRFYSLASYFGLPDIRHNEARSALSERSDVRQGDIRTGPDHRTNYPNIASRNAEGRGGGGCRHGESGRGYRFRTARLRQRTCRSSPHRNPRGLRNPPASRHAAPSSGIRPASCYRCTRRPSRSSDAHKLVRKTHSQPPFPNFRPIHKT